MCLNLTDRTIVVSDPVRPGRPRENSFSKIFTLKMISRTPDDRQDIGFSFFSMPFTKPTSDKNFKALSQFFQISEFSLSFSGTFPKYINLDTCLHKSIVNKHRSTTDLNYIFIFYKVDKYLN